MRENIHTIDLQVECKYFLPELNLKHRILTESNVKSKKQFLSSPVPMILNGSGTSQGHFGNLQGHFLFS